MVTGNGQPQERVLQSSAVQAAVWATDYRAEPSPAGLILAFMQRDFVMDPRVLMVVSKVHIDPEMVVSLHADLGVIVDAMRQAGLLPEA